MANSDTSSSINSSDPAKQAILHLNNSEFETLEPRNSTEIAHTFPNSTDKNPDISPIQKQPTFQDLSSLPISETNTCTLSPKLDMKTTSMRSVSSHGTESNSSLISTKPPSLDGLPPLHPIQIKILREVKRNLEISREKVIKLEVENKQIPVLRKRLDQLETEIRLQSIVSPDESGHAFSTLLSSSVPVSHLGSSQLSDGELSPAMLLVEVYRVLNCGGAGLANVLDGTAENKDFLPYLRKVLLQRISELKKTELQGASAHQKMLDTLSRQVVCINARSEDVSRKLSDFRANIKMVSTAREEIAQKGSDYFLEQWDAVIRDRTPAEERVKALQLQCTQLQQKVDHYKNSIMFYKTENDTLITQLQPFKTASKATTSILEEVKSLRTLVANTQKENAAQTAGTAGGVGGQEKFRKLEEERDSANKLAQDCQQRASSLSASLHQVSSLMMEEKNRNDTLRKLNKELDAEIQSLKCEMREFNPKLESQIAELRSDMRMKEREVAQLLESLQRHEMTKDDLRQAEKELKQFRTKCQFFETRNKELTDQLAFLVEKESSQGGKLDSLESELKKRKELVLSLQALFPPAEPAMTLLDQVQGLRTDLRDSRELVEFLQEEKKVETESLTMDSSQTELSDVKQLKETISHLQNEKSLFMVTQEQLKNEIAEMKLTREAFISRIDALESQLEDSNFSQTSANEELIETLQKQLEVDKAHYEMRNQDLSDQIVELDSVMHGSDVQNAKERDSLQTQLERLTQELGEAKDSLAKQTTELENKTDQIDLLKRELETKKAQAQEMMEKFFPGGAPTAQLVSEANKKLQESLQCEKDQILKQREEHQNLEQQVGLLDTWVQQYKKERDSYEQERDQLKEVNQANLRKIKQLEGKELECKQLKKELTEVEREVSALRRIRREETNEQKIQDLSRHK